MKNQNIRNEDLSSTDKRINNFVDRDRQWAPDLEKTRRSGRDPRRRGVDYHVLHLVGDVEGEICCGAASSPGDVAEGRVVRNHAVHALEEIVDAIFRLRWEELEGEYHLPFLRSRLDLLNHLHLSLSLSAGNGRRRREGRERKGEGGVDGGEGDESESSRARK